VSGEARRDTILDMPAQVQIPTSGLTICRSTSRQATSSRSGNASRQRAIRSRCTNGSASLLEERLTAHEQAPDDAQRGSRSSGDWRRVFGKLGRMKVRLRPEAELDMLKNCDLVRLSRRAHMNFNELDTVALDETSPREDFEPAISRR
jgi:hypothetical protein